MGDIHAVQTIAPKTALVEIVWGLDTNQDVDGLNKYTAALRFPAALCNPESEQETAPSAQTL